jgi:hypothetical protein
LRYGPIPLAKHAGNFALGYNIFELISFRHIFGNINCVKVLSMMLVTYIHWIKFDKAGFCHDGVRLDSGMYFYINEINKQQIMSIRKIANQELKDKAACILYLEFCNQSYRKFAKQ